jgi:5-methylcytosine-specific restriction endonuclease McrA
MKTRDTHGLEKQRFAERRSTELKPLSPELLALIGTPVPGKATLPKIRKNKVVARAVEKVAKEKRHVPSKDEKGAFYASWEWRTLRMLTLRRFGRSCACCGATPRHRTLGGQPVRLVVDHIRPLGTHWHLRLDAENLQVLCDDCNMGKGGVHIADFRA